MVTNPRTYKGMSSRKHYTKADKEKWYALHLDGVETCHIAARFGCSTSLVSECIKAIKKEKTKS